MIMRDGRVVENTLDLSNGAIPRFRAAEDPLVLAACARAMVFVLRMAAARDARVVAALLFFFICIAWRRGDRRAAVGHPERARRAWHAKRGR
jgi:hypothetical protein